MMDKSKQESGSAEPAVRKSGLSRLGVILGVFALAAGGIWGFQKYLESGIPQEDARFVKARGEDAEPEEKQSSLAVLSEMFSAPKPSKEIEELKAKSADEVVFTYDQIMEMTPDELQKNIEDVTRRLGEKRKDLPPSFGAGSMAPAEKNSEDDAKDNSTIPSLALPLEVMRQRAESQK